MWPDLSIRYNRIYFSPLDLKKSQAIATTYCYSESIIWKMYLGHVFRVINELVVTSYMRLTTHNIYSNKYSL